MAATQAFRLCGERNPLTLHGQITTLGIGVNPKKALGLPLVLGPTCRVLSEGYPS